MTICAIVQARMGSSRFPGKMLREIAGMPLIWHVIHRLQQCKTVAQVILATSDKSTDDELAAYVGSLGIALVRGSEQNVLQRFIKALELTDADIILRITGDAVLIDPALIDRLAHQMESSSADYCVTSAPVSDCGIDFISRPALLRLASERGDHPAAIEHVTGYLSIDPDFAQRVVLPVDGEDRFIEGARFSVDTPVDLDFMKEIYRHLAAPAGEAKFLDVLALLRAKPELLAINAHIRQRRADDTPLSVLMRCDGGHDLGLGHMVRCLAIAAVLRDRFSAAVSFATRADAAALTLVRAQAFPIHALSGLAPAAELAAILNSVSPDIVVMDLRTPFDAAEIAAIRDAGSLLAVVDDAGPRRLHADIGFFPPSGAALDWRGATGETCIGFQWIALRQQFSPPPPRRLSLPPRALIVAGGSDPGGIGQRWFASAARALPRSWRIGMVIGAAAVDDPQLRNLADQIGERVTFHRHVADMASLMAEADLALAAFGMTAYELVAVGVPILLLCLSEDHRRSALALAEKGAARIVGIAHEVGDAALDQAVAQICGDAAVRDAMSRNSRLLVDGRGATRIAERLAALVKNSRRAVVTAR